MIPIIFSIVIIDKRGSAHFEKDRTNVRNILSNLSLEVMERHEQSNYKKIILLANKLFCRMRAKILKAVAKCPL